MTTLLSNKHYFVTDFRHPAEPVQIISQQRTATIRFDHWCQREVERWKATNGRECWLREDDEGLVALVSHAEYQKPVGQEDES